jgi:hypothetical protein
MLDESFQADREASDTLNLNKQVNCCVYGALDSASKLSGVKK